MARIEAAIQAALIAWVKLTYPMLMITASANERAYKEISQIGCLGIPDLILFHPDGRVFFLELKRKKGKLQQSQIDWAIWYNEQGFTHPHVVAYGFAEAREAIENWFIGNPPFSHSCESARQD